MSNVIPGVVLTHPKGSPPLGVLAAMAGAGVELELRADPKLNKMDPICLIVDKSGDTLDGIASVLRFVMRSSSSTDSLYGCSPVSACQIDSFLEFAEQRVVPGAGIEAACASMNIYLSCRTYFVDHCLTVADLAIWGQLQAVSQWRGLRTAYPHLARWFDNIDHHPLAVSTMEKHSTKSSGKGAKKVDHKAVKTVKGDAGDPFAIKLPNAIDGKVVTRFPPEPSGYLHIGHAKAAILNQEIANRYHGRLLMRFDDTNPTKEKDEFVENIINDCKSLGLQYEKITYTSDYFPQLFECGERMIKSGILYADDTPLEQMREERMHGVESAQRNRPVEETMRIWKEMLMGTEEGAKNCIRVKLDMQHVNKALRDPVCFRCNSTPHWRTGDTYKCYPTYDFACPFVDAYEGVTHALRTSEYSDREAQFYWILKLQQQVWPELPDVVIWDYARLSFVYTVLSKRKLTWFVQNGVVKGWDDPRMPTVQGILRRGLKLEALREFMLTQGASKNITLQEWDKIWTINKKMIDPVCPRHTAVETVAKVPVTLAGAPEEAVEVPKHAKYPPAGMKTQLRSGKIWLDQSDAILLVEGEEITLMGWGNAIVNKVHKSSDLSRVESVEATLHLEGDFKKTKLKLTWLSDSNDIPKLELHHFGYLITKKKLEQDDEFEDFVNKDSEIVINAIGDINMKQLGKGEVIQLERKGYYIVDVPFNIEKPDDSIVLFDIPDGRSKSKSQ